jgi:4-amino-4-deoxy-L-arabinose transferase-like glycosyltransferase
MSLRGTSDQLRTPIVSTLAPARAVGRWTVGRARVAEWALDAALMLGLAAAAFWMRWPDLYTVPALTDEADDLMHALSALREGRLPLASVSVYIGPLFTWFFMGVFAVLGPSPTIGRTVVLLADCAAVALTYALGRAVGGRWVGLIAGALLVPNIVHTLIISHIAWSNCVTPLFSTATLLLLVRALQRGAPHLLPAVAFLGALTIQTHPFSALVMLCLGPALLLHPIGRGWLRTRWLPLSLLAAVVGYAPLLVHNIIRPLQTVRGVLDKEYAYHPAASLPEYLGSLGEFLVQYVRTLASVVEEPVRLPELLFRPQVVPLLALLLLGMGVAWRRQHHVLPLALVVSALLMSFLGGDYRWLPVTVSRYLGHLWPIGYVLVGLGAVAAARWAWAAGAALAGTGRARWATALRWGVTAAMAAAIVGPGLYGQWRATTDYRAWYAQQPRVGDYNAFVYDLARRIAREWPGERVWLDRELWNDGLVDGGNAWMGLRFVLETSGIATGPLHPPDGSDLEELRATVGPGSVLVVLPHRHGFYLSEQGARLEELARYQSGRLRNRGAWSLYRLAPAEPGRLRAGAG